MHAVEEIRKAPDVVQKLIAGLLVTCTCGCTVSNDRYAAHVNGDYNGENSNAAKSETIKNVLSQPADAPLTSVEMQLQTTLAKRSLATSPEHNILRMKTGGQVSMLKYMYT